ncbi:tetratricopeptide repeat protein [Azonexus sp.]|uniref:L,D-transpeptidase Cds6 family protein n=1 Tax=Azonexus sp. TaxID=1872668 RepID=UPI0039E2EEB1
MTTSPRSHSRSCTSIPPRSHALRAIALGLCISFSAPVFADNLPEIQRLIKQGQHAQALEKTEQYLSSRPKDAQGRFLKGIILTEMNRPADAIGVFTKLSEDYPELPEPYNNLAVLYAQQKQYDKARTALEMAIRTHPSYAIAYENLGDVYAKLASQAYDKALQLDNANAATQNKLALIRDLISTSGKGNVRPPAPATPTGDTATLAAAQTTPPTQPSPTKTAAATPANTVTTTPPATTASVVATTAGAAAQTPLQTAASKTTAAPQAAAAEKPAAKETPASSKPAAPANGNDAVLAALNNWAHAWSSKNMKAYFAAYTSSFAPNGMSRKDWENERQQRIGKRGGKISVSFDEPSISIEGDQAKARFRQHYKAPGLNSSSTKTLVFVHSGGKWLIKEEIAR